MEKITEFKSFDKTNSRDKNALRKVRKFNFYNDHTIISIYDDLGIDCFAAKATPVIANDEYYVFLRYLNKNNWQDTTALVGAYDVLTTDDNLSFTYRPDEKLTKIWRGVMLRIYGEDYKKMLIKVLKDRKNRIDVALDQELNSLQ